MLNLLWHVIVSTNDNRTTIVTRTSSLTHSTTRSHIRKFYKQHLFMQSEVALPRHYLTLTPFIKSSIHTIVITRPVMSPCCPTLTLFVTFHRSTELCTRGFRSIGRHCSKMLAVYAGGSCSLALTQRHRWTQTCTQTQETTECTNICRFVYSHTIRWSSFLSSCSCRRVLVPVNFYSCQNPKDYSKMPSTTVQNHPQIALIMSLEQSGHGTYRR